MKRKTMLVRPRNPLVAPAKFRKAGAHGKSEKALRRATKMEIRGVVGREDAGTWLLPRHTKVRVFHNPPLTSYAC